MELILYSLVFFFSFFVLCDSTLCILEGHGGIFFLFSFSFNFFSLLFQKILFFCGPILHTFFLLMEAKKSKKGGLVFLFYLIPIPAGSHERHEFSPNGLKCILVII